MQEKKYFLKYACVLYVLWCDWYHMEKCKKIFAKYRPSFFLYTQNTVVKGLVKGLPQYKGLVTYGLGAINLSLHMEKCKKKVFSQYPCQKRVFYKCKNFRPFFLRIRMRSLVMWVPRKCKKKHFLKYACVLYVLTGLVVPHGARIH